LTNVSGVADWFVGGWQISGLTTLQSGRPFTVVLSSDTANIGTAGNQRPVVVGDPKLSGVDRSADHWFNTAAFAIPARGTFGNLGRNTLIGPSFKNSDLSLIKNNQIREATKVQFRAEIFNLLNHPNLHLPERQIDSQTAGKVFAAEFSRQIQFGLKIIY
jgi:hypothetical protein